MNPPLPCLWCGSRYPQTKAVLDLYMVRCPDCGACGPERKNAERAAQSWNNGPKFQRERDDG